MIIKKGSVSVAHSRNSPGLLPKMWPQCSWNIYIFPDNWTASILEQHCWCNENVFRSHLYSCVVAIVSSSLPLSCLAFTYCRTKYISPVCSPCEGDMEHCFKFYMLRLTFLFPRHYSDTEYMFPRRALVVHARYRFAPCPSALWFLHPCRFVHLALRKWSGKKKMSSVKSACFSVSAFVHNHVPYLILHFMHWIKTLINESLYTKPPPCDCYVHWTCFALSLIKLAFLYKKKKRTMKKS